MAIFDFTSGEPPVPHRRFGGGRWHVREISRPSRNTDITVAVNSPEMHVAFPGICKTLGGDLLVVYREGFTHAATDDPADGRIMIVRSRDLGETWGNPKVLVETDAHDDRNSAIACMSDGTLVMCWDKYLKGAHHGAFFVTSGDEGQTWSGPTRLDLIDNVHTRSPAIELNGSEWLFPVPCSDSTGDDPATYGVIYNRATGEQQISLITPRGDRNIADECALARTKEGLLVALIRSNSDPVLWQTVSYDRGRTWLPAWKSEIPSQFTPADLITLEDGALLCSFSFRERRNERQCISRDDGVTWSVEDSIDVYDGVPPSADRSYPAAVEVEPGTIGTVLYETHPHPNGGRIYFCRTNVAQFEASRRSALCQDDPHAAGPSIALPAPGSMVRLTYRFTGHFGAPPNAISVDLCDKNLDPLVTAGYRVGVTPDRKTSPPNWVTVLGEAGDVLHDAPAVGDWFDDGNEHQLSLTWGEGLEFAIDGHPQCRLPTNVDPAHLALRTTRAAVAVYEIVFG